MLRATELELSVLPRELVRLEVGQPNFNTPAHIVNATIIALQSNKTAYIPNAGSTQLRQAISEHYCSKGIPTTHSQIIVTTGSMLSMFSLAMSLLQPGDECLHPLPGFGNYQQISSLIRCRSIPYLCRPNDGYLPRISEIERLIGPKTKCIVICNPGNPTGAVYNRKLLEEIIQLCKERNIFVISDGSDLSTLFIHLISNSQTNLLSRNILGYCIRIPAYLCGSI